MEPPIQPERPAHAWLRVLRGLVALAAIVFPLGILVAPWLDSAGLPSWGLRLLYAPLCHQLPERTLTWLGHPMAVCARCAGLYLGGAAAVAVVALRGFRARVPHRFWFFALVGPVAMDAVLPWIGLPQLTAVPRHALAWVAGAALGWFFATGLCELTRSRRRSDADVDFFETVEVGHG